MCAKWIGHCYDRRVGLSLDVLVAMLAATTVASASPKPKQATKRNVKAKTTTKTQTHAKTTAKPSQTALRDSQPAQERTDPSRLAMPKDVTALPAYHYGQLSRAQCEAELGKRKIQFRREAAAGVLAPVRLEGELHGIRFRGDLAEKERATSPYEIVDCRLVLALDDFADLLARHDIVEVRHYSMYRPDKTLAAGVMGTRHSGALAFDAGRFIDKDGKELVVDRDFHGAIDAKTCGDGAMPDPVTPEALALRAILCDAVDAHLFNVVLTPNYNQPHHNHFHLEVTPGVKWFLVH